MKIKEPIALASSHFFEQMHKVFTACHHVHPLPHGFVIQIQPLELILLVHDDQLDAAVVRPMLPCVGRKYLRLINRIIELRPVGIKDVGDEPLFRLPKSDDIRVERMLLVGYAERPPSRGTMRSHAFTLLSPSMSSSTTRVSHVFSFVSKTCSFVA